jgi:hypothetical protein
MDLIYEVENVISKELCVEIIDKFEKDPQKYPGLVKGGVADFSIKKSIDLTDGDISKWRNIYDNLFSIFHEHENKYMKRITNKCMYTCPQIQRTDPGGYFKWHSDQNSNRVLSFILYLNTLEEDDGGTTDFECGKIIRPVTGKLVIFPATDSYVHRGSELIKGVKYIVTSFSLNDDKV